MRDESGLRQLQAKIPDVMSTPWRAKADVGGVPRGEILLGAVAVLHTIATEGSVADWGRRWKKETWAPIGPGLPTVRGWVRSMFIPEVQGTAAAYKWSVQAWDPERQHILTLCPEDQGEPVFCFEPGWDGKASRDYTAWASDFHSLGVSRDDARVLSRLWTSEGLDVPEAVTALTGERRVYQFSRELVDTAEVQVIRDSDAMIATGHRMRTCLSNLAAEPDPDTVYLAIRAGGSRADMAAARVYLPGLYRAPTAIDEVRRFANGKPLQEDYDLLQEWLRANGLAAKVFVRTNPH